MCTCGMAMATQQATPATHSAPCACARLRPKGRSDGVAACPVPGPAGLGRVSERVSDRESEQNGAQSVQRDRWECEQVGRPINELVYPSQGGFKGCHRSSKLAFAP